jgi:hypothetical protein
MEQTERKVFKEKLAQLEQTALWVQKATQEM